MQPVEAVARLLCMEAGGDPDLIMREYGQTSWTYRAWEDYRAEADALMLEQGHPMILKMQREIEKSEAAEARKADDA